MTVDEPEANVGQARVDGDVLLRQAEGAAMGVRYLTTRQSAIEKRVEALEARAALSESLIVAVDELRAAVRDHAATRHQRRRRR